MNPVELIDKYYKDSPIAKDILIKHSRLVADKAVEIAKKIHDKVDEGFIYEAAMLHDIGIFYTNAKDIGCNGDKPYICHGFLGRELLDKEGLKKHALVCERHTGAGLTIEEIQLKNLPLPKREMIPITLEEMIICYADKFFSKNPKKIHVEKSYSSVEKMMQGYGDYHINKFREWHKRFNV